MIGLRGNQAGIALLKGGVLIGKSDKAKTVAVEKKIDSNTPTINQNPAAVAAEKAAAQGVAGFGRSL